MDVDALTIGARTGFPEQVQTDAMIKRGSRYWRGGARRTPIEAKRGRSARECSNRQVVEHAEVGDRGGDVWVWVADRVLRLRVYGREVEGVSRSESPRRLP